MRNGCHQLIKELWKGQNSGFHLIVPYENDVY